MNVTLSAFNLMQCITVVCIQYTGRSSGRSSARLCQCVNQSEVPPRNLEARYIHARLQVTQGNVCGRVDRAGLRHWGAPCQKVMGLLPLPLPSPPLLPPLTPAPPLHPALDALPPPAALDAASPVWVRGYNSRKIFNLLYCCR